MENNNAAGDDGGTAASRQAVVRMGRATRMARAPGVITRPGQADCWRQSRVGWVTWVGLPIVLEHEAGPSALHWLRLGGLAPFLRELTLSFRFTNSHVEIHWLPALYSSRSLWRKDAATSLHHAVWGGKYSRQGMRFSATY
jgi:hypothetical protein